MAHFVQIVDGVVVSNIVVHNNELLVNGVENEAKGKEFCHKLLGGEWIQTSYNNKFRKQYASIGFTYDPIKDQFIAPQPYPSWSLDSNNDWQPPTPRPSLTADWNETIEDWLDFPSEVSDEFLD